MQQCPRTSRWLHRSSEMSATSSPRQCLATHRSQFGDSLPRAGATGDSSRRGTRHESACTGRQPSASQRVGQPISQSQPQPQPRPEAGNPSRGSGDEARRELRGDDLFRDRQRRVRVRCTRRACVARSFRPGVPDLRLAGRSVAGAGGRVIIHGGKHVDCCVCLRKSS